MIRFFSKEKLPKEFKHFLAPKKEFVKRGEQIFLAAYSTKYPVQSTHLNRWMFAARFAVIVVLVSGTLGGTAFYADAENVSPANPLYQLKRYSESVRVALTPQKNQAELHLSLARRRFAEIQEVKKTTPTSTELVNLKGDLNIELGSITEDDDTNEMAATSSETMTATSTSTSTKENTSEKKEGNQPPFQKQLFFQALSSSSLHTSSSAPTRRQLKNTAQVCGFIHEAVGSDSSTINELFAENGKLAIKIQGQCNRLDERQEKINTRAEMHTTTNMNVRKSTSTPTEEGNLKNDRKEEEKVGTGEKDSVRLPGLNLNFRSN